MQVRIIVTDVTKVGDERCVAGWDLGRRTMIRPEPGPGSFWSPDMTDRGAAFEAGAVTSFAVRAGDAGTRYPHRTEDRIVVGEVVRLQAP